MAELTLDVGHGRRSWTAVYNWTAGPSSYCAIRRLRPLSRVGMEWFRLVHATSPSHHASSVTRDAASVERRDELDAVLCNSTLRYGAPPPASVLPYSFALSNAVIDSHIVRL